MSTGPVRIDMDVDTAAASVVLVGLAQAVDALSSRPRTYSWRGRQYPGAMRDRRAAKRTEAEERNVRTRPERRRAARQGMP